ncbi:MAG: FtsX-like permease family protein, partial [Candidatus Izemoplasmatales bacterium]|nr:FtsX-like permease family protein [Candidatus Izemoplasmatales bacterium]
MKLAFQIATRFLKSGKLQTFMIILGIAVGVSVQVFIGSLITGLQRSLVDKTIGSSSQITIKVENNSSFISNYETLITQIYELDSQIETISPSISAGVSLRSLTGTEIITEQSLLRGFDFVRANQIYKFNDKLTQGVLPTESGQIVLGSLLFQSLGIGLNDFIEIVVPSGPFSFEVFEVEVVGVFDFNVRAINQSWSLASLGVVQNILGQADVVNSIEMQIKDVFEAQAISARIESTLVENDYVVENWIDQNAELLSGLQGQSVSSLMIQVFVMISVVLAIASVLAITVLQKSKQIGILKAMGIQDKDASMVFLFEGLILGVFGAIGGVLLGLGLAVSFTTFAIGADGNPVVPLFIDYGFIALSALIAVIAATIASLIPARKSSKLS